MHIFACFGSLFKNVHIFHFSSQYNLYNCSKFSNNLLTRAPRALAQLVEHYAFNTIGLQFQSGHWQLIEACLCSNCTSISEWSIIIKVFYIGTFVILFAKISTPFPTSFLSKINLFCQSMNLLILVLWIQFTRILIK